MVCKGRVETKRPLLVRDDGGTGSFDRQTETDRQRQTDRDRWTETDRQRQTDRDRQTETDRQRQTDRDRQRQTETDRDRQRQTDRQTDCLLVGSPGGFPVLVSFPGVPS